MGFVDWLKRRGLPGQIPKNARAQFLKWRARAPEMSEAEIAEGIFMLRYAMAKPPLDDQELHRFAAYMDSAFSFNSLLDFCLASLDIEGGLSPRDEEAFFEIEVFIERELIRTGHVVGTDDGSKFVARWRAQIAPLREGADTRPGRVPASGGSQWH